MVVFVFCRSLFSGYVILVFTFMALASLIMAGGFFAVMAGSFFAVMAGGFFAVMAGVCLAFMAGG